MYVITVTGFIYPLTCGFAFMIGRVRTMVPAATRSRSTLRIKDTKRLSKRTELICSYCMINVSAPVEECTVCIMMYFVLKVLRYKYVCI